VTQVDEKKSKRGEANNPNPSALSFTRKGKPPTLGPKEKRNDFGKDVQKKRKDLGTALTRKHKLLKQGPERGEKKGGKTSLPRKKKREGKKRKKTSPN